MKILLFVLFIFKFGVNGSSLDHQDADASNFDPVNKEYLQDETSVLLVDVFDIEEEESCLLPLIELNSYLRIFRLNEGHTAFNYSLITPDNFFYSSDSSPPKLGESDSFLF
ncbi:MAG: hypothetical protein ACERKD_14175 [Prolixibacteraceae bacterium]